MEIAIKESAGIIVSFFKYFAKSVLSRIHTHTLPLILFSAHFLIRYNHQNVSSPFSFAIELFVRVRVCRL